MHSAAQGYSKTCNESKEEEEEIALQRLSTLQFEKAKSGFRP
jgi:hypothetical protein